MDLDAELSMSHLVEDPTILKLPKTLTPTPPSLTPHPPFLPSGSSNWPCQCGLQICPLFSAFSPAYSARQVSNGQHTGSSTDLALALLQVQEDIIYFAS